MKHELQQLVKTFIANSRERQGQVDFYLDRVEDCISPGLQVKFALWGLDQKDEFYQQPGLWSTLLAKEVGLTPEQMVQLKEQRSAVAATREDLKRCEKMVKDVSLLLPRCASLYLAVLPSSLACFSHLDSCFLLCRRCETRLGRICTPSTSRWIRSRVS